MTKQESIESIMDEHLEGCDLCSRMRTPNPCWSCLTEYFKGAYRQHADMELVAMLERMKAKGIPMRLPDYNSPDFKHKDIYAYDIQAEIDRIKGAMK